MGNAIVFERETHKVQHLGQVRCSGQESRLTYCSHDDVDVNKYSNNVAAVTCAGGCGILVIVKYIPSMYTTFSLHNKGECPFTMYTHVTGKHLLAVCIQGV